MYKLCKFQVNILFVTDFMNLQSSKSGCVNYARFRKSGHICIIRVLMQYCISFICAIFIQCSCYVRLWPPLLYAIDTVANLYCMLCTSYRVQLSH